MAAAQNAKADFGEIYRSSDPRKYYSTLVPLDYTLATAGVAVFDRLLDARRRMGLPVRTVFDVCSSFGIVGSLLTTTLSFSDFYLHYRGLGGLGPGELRRADTGWLRDHRRTTAPRVLGLDIAPEALQYSESVGSLDRGFLENLEEEHPSPELRDELGGVDLVTVTGGIGYVGATTFARLAQHTPANRWIAAFCSRTVDFAPIERVLAEYGLVTEEAPDTYPQRRFVDEREQRWAVREVERHGYDPAGLEDEGFYHARLFVSRPRSHVQAVPLPELLHVA